MSGRPGPPPSIYINRGASPDRQPSSISFLPSVYRTSLGHAVSQCRAIRALPRSSCGRILPPPICGPSSVQPRWLPARPQRTIVIHSRRVRPSALLVGWFSAISICRQVRVVFYESLALRPACFVGPRSLLSFSPSILSSSHPPVAWDGLRVWGLRRRWCGKLGTRPGSCCPGLGLSLDLGPPAIGFSDRVIGAILETPLPGVMEMGLSTLAFRRLRIRGILALSCSVRATPALTFQIVALNLYGYRRRRWSEMSHVSESACVSVLRLILAVAQSICSRDGAWK